MKLPFKQEDFLGNIRSGKRRDNNSPCNIDHFNVHYDSYTSEYSMALFESVYKGKTDKLLIIPVTNMIINYEVFKKEGKCRGVEGKTAIRVDSKGKEIEVNCNPETCEFANSGKIKCKRTGRIYFRLVGIEEKGVWCYTTGSKRMVHIQKYLDLMVEKGIDITKNKFLLTLNETSGASGGKVYAPDIRIVNENDNDNKVQEKTNQEKQQKLKENTGEQNKTQNPNNPNDSNNSKDSKQESKNFYVYVDGKMVEQGEKKYPRLVFMNKEREAKVFFMTKDSKPDILGLEAGSVIEITKVLANKNNDQFLMDYNIIKRIDKNKKAV